MKKLLFLVLIVFILPGIIQGNSVSLENTETIVTNRRINFTWLGLDEDQSYIMVFTQTSVSIDNQTFTSSGYAYSLDVFIPDDIDNSMIVSLYEYSISTGINSSSVLSQVTLRLLKNSDFNNIDYIIENLIFVIPLFVIALFTGILIKQLRSWIE